MYALFLTAKLNIYCGYYAAAGKHADEIVAFANPKGGGSGRRWGCFARRGIGVVGNAPHAAQKDHLRDQRLPINGFDCVLPGYLSHLAKAHAQASQVDDAWRCIGEVMAAMEASGEIWSEAEVNRIAGEIALKSPQRDTAKAEAYFERALTVGRQQQAKSWKTPRRNEPRTPLARPGQGAASARTACSGLRLVQ